MSNVTEAPAPEPQGYMSAPGFVKSNPLNNDHYVSQFENDPWYPIIKRTHDELNCIVPGYNISQIKEKFGGLRYYISFPEEWGVGAYGWIKSFEEAKSAANALIGRAEAWVDGYETAKREFREKESEKK